MRSFAEHPSLKHANQSPSGRERARGWFRDPALWVWLAVGLLALLPLRSALVQLAIS